MSQPPAAASRDADHENGRRPPLRREIRVADAAGLLGWLLYAKHHAHTRNFPQSTRARANRAKKTERTWFAQHNAVDSTKLNDEASVCAPTTARAQIQGRKCGWDDSGLDPVAGTESRLSDTRDLVFPKYLRNLTSIRALVRRSDLNKQESRWFTNSSAEFHDVALTRVSIIPCSNGNTHTRKSTCIHIQPPT